MTIAELIHVPYAEDGRTLEGADCWGLARLALEVLGFELPHDPLIAMVDRTAIAVARPIGERRIAGDVLELVGPEAGYGKHVGVCLDAYRFIHMTSACGVRIERICAWRRARKILGVSRLKRGVGVVGVGGVVGVVA
jgi:cell wall-associated NlpC family hydrolase